MQDDKHQSMSTGVLIGCDAEQEWLLAWWYEHFRKQNPHCPLAIADFGMTPQARKWCEQKGVMIDLPPSKVPAAPSDGFLYNHEKWTMLPGKTPWPTLCKRLVWFQKPLAIRLAPFDRVLWIDLDCKIRKNLDPLLSFPLKSAKIALRPTGICKIYNLSKNQPALFKGYNSGVVLVEKNSPVLDIWIEGVQHDPVYYFYSDDMLLSFYIGLHAFQKIRLPLKYNWQRTLWGENPEALIDHWEKEAGKLAIRLFEMTHHS